MEGLAVPVVAALITAGFAFSAAIVGILWTDHNKRREEERKHYREANMFRRVVAADLQFITAQLDASINSIKARDFDPVTFQIPTGRTYSLEKMGLLTVDEIKVVWGAISMLAHQQAAVRLIETMAKNVGVIDGRRRHNEPDWFDLPLNDVTKLLPEIATLQTHLQTAIRELKAETGPVP